MGPAALGFFLCCLESQHMLGVGDGLAKPLRWHLLVVSNLFLP